MEGELYMIPAKVEFKIDNQFIQEQLEKTIVGNIQSELWFVDVDRIAVLTNMSKRFLEDEIFSDPRMRVIERRKNRKRWWPAKEALDVMKTITSEW